MRRSNPLLTVVTHLLLLAGLVVTMVPFLWMAATSVKPDAEIYGQGLGLVPHEPTLQHYATLSERVPLGRTFANSCVVAGAMTALAILVNSLAAFAFAKLRFPGRERLFALLMVTMMVPGQVTMMPVFLILKGLGLLDSYLGLVIPGCAGIFAIFMLRQFMEDIPDELVEAARIDGCSDLRIYWSIMLPLCRPVLATLVVFTFLGAWNEFLWPLIILQDERMYTLPVALANLSGRFATAWGLLMAGAVVVLVPVVVVFLLAQKHYIRGLAAGAVKG